MKKILSRENILGIFSIILCSIIIRVHFSTVESFSQITFPNSFKNLLDSSKTINLVTTVYLDYRVFDTILETLLLLIAITAIFQFIQLESFEKKIGKAVSLAPDKYIPSAIRSYTISIIYPLFILLGVYEILNGVSAPGGGFQGGAILASVLMIKYIVVPSHDYNYELTFIAEKIFFILIVLIVSLHFFLAQKLISYDIYLLALNILIGAKVAFGISTIFLRFIYYEKE